MDISETSALWKCEYKHFFIKCVWTVFRKLSVLLLISNVRLVLNVVFFL